MWHSTFCVCFHSLTYRICSLSFSSNDFSSCQRRRLHLGSGKINLWHCRHSGADIRQDSRHTSWKYRTSLLVLLCRFPISFSSLSSARLGVENLCMLVKTVGLKLRRGREQRWWIRSPLLSAAFPCSFLSVFLVQSPPEVRLYFTVESLSCGRKPRNLWSKTVWRN